MQPVRPLTIPPESRQASQAGVPAAQREQPRQRARRPRRIQRSPKAFAIHLLSAVSLPWSSAKSLTCPRNCSTCWQYVFTCLRKPSIRRAEFLRSYPCCSQDVSQRKAAERAFGRWSIGTVGPLTTNPAHPTLEFQRVASSQTLRVTSARLQTSPCPVAIWPLPASPPPKSHPTG